MDAQAVTSDYLVKRWPLLAAAAIACFAVTILPRVVQNVLSRLQLSRLPVIGHEVGNKESQRLAYLRNARKLYNDGYQKFANGVFRITTSRTSSVIVVSAKFLPELKKLPDDILSMSAAVDETMETKYTKIETTVPIIPATIKAQLTPALVRLNPTIAEEVQAAFEIEIPETDDWKEVHLHEKLLRIVAMVSGRLFIGPELCRTEKYLDASIKYTEEVMAAQRAVQNLRPWLRPLLAPRQAEVRQVAERLKEINDFLAPIVKQRLEYASVAPANKPDDMLQWLVDGRKEYPDKNSQDLAKVQAGLSFAAIHTTTLTGTNAFYNLAAFPEMALELREEVRQVLAENDGIFTSNALQSMKKLDSFLKETLRVHPATMASFQRKVLQRFSLSNGQIIPAGSVIEVPAVAISSDQTLYPSAQKFDGLRFYRLREQAKKEGSNEGAAHNQFVSVSQSSLTFGYGRHACPGRFFAANELKMILANAVLKYDIKLVDGSSERYLNIEFAHMSIPDTRKTLLFKKLDAQTGEQRS